MFSTVLYWLFAAAIAAQYGYAIYFFLRICYLPQQSNKKKLPAKPVSVIICARNEATNLQRNLPAILSQIYNRDDGTTAYEVIVVNDCATDHTEIILATLEKRYSHLRHITVTADEKRTFKGKKFALSRGMQAAKYDLLLLTDADCRPAGTAWLSGMTAPLLEGREIVCGYGAFSKKPGLLNVFTRWETMHTFLQYSTYTLAGIPYMAVGRNLACTRSILTRAQQSAIWNQLPSGDDDLLIRECAHVGNTTVVADPQTFTMSETPETRVAWLRQKQRHLSTGKYYKPHIRYLLGGYALSHAAVWILWIPVAASGYMLPAMALFMLRCILYWGIWTAAAIRLRDRYLVPFFPFFDASWVCYNLLLSPYIFFKNKQRW